MDILIGGLAGSGAGFFSNPMDVLKTRMQLQGELQTKGQHVIHYRNTFHAAVVIVKNEGFLALQKGLVPALFMHFVRNSIRLGIYQGINKRGYLIDENGRTIFYRSVIVSGMAGATGAFFGSPLFMIKTQLQAQSAKKIAVGHQHKHSDGWTALRSVYQDRGIKGLWRGASGTILRAVAGSSAQLSTFAVTKDILKFHESLANYPLIVSFLASIVGSVFQCVMMQPFDLVSTRLYNQGVDARGRGLLYTGVVDCFIKVAQMEGLHGFFKGITANYMRLAPHGVLTLVFWDALINLQQNIESRIATK